MIEGHRVASFIFDALAADTGVGGVKTLLGSGSRIYRDRVPQGTGKLPAATVTLVSHVDQGTLGGRRVFAVTLVDVRLICDGSDYTPILAASDRADTVLQNLSGTKSGVTIVELRRDGVQQFIEDDSGKSYAHIIATYRTEAYAA